jgi:hypothetical protein
LASLGGSGFDELWLLAVDVGDGLSAADCAGIDAFHRRGGGILATRDHQDLGSSLHALRAVGACHHFQSRNREPDPARHARDDVATRAISWPNYHSGRNGDLQRVTPVGVPHPLLRGADGRVLARLPAHPHEGCVGAPPGDPHARVIATGRSLTTERTFNLAVARDPAGPGAAGRVVAQSSFHHFADYNWDPALGAPSFVSEAPGDEVRRDPHALADVRDYVRNLAVWLAPPRRRAGA